MGVVIADDQGVALRTLHRWLGRATNNEAEYHALIEGLKALVEWKPDRIEIYLDSNLVVEQVKGKYKVKKPELQVLHRQVMVLLEHFEDRSIVHIDREKNRAADKLANMAIDARVKKASAHG